MSRQRLVVGNWKMNGSRSSNALLLDALVASAADAGARATGSMPVRLAVAPPFPYLAQVAQRLAGSGLGWGAQDVSAQADGAHTGEVSASMLLDMGCQFALVGHSERRSRWGESDANVAAKAAAALTAGLMAIVCIGESLSERESGATEAVLSRQVQALKALPSELTARLALAYEPVWAIGTGRSATPELAQDSHAFIRQQLKASIGAAAELIPILYGGSVKPDNASALFAMPDIDGGLVGGASLKAADFLAIWRAAG
jgi:triosephosphate isomerase